MRMVVSELVRKHNDYFITHEFAMVGGGAALWRGAGSAAARLLLRAWAQHQRRRG